MHGNTYEVDPELAGRQVDLIFDPLELTEVQVRLDGRGRGMAVARVIKRHVHPRAQPAPEKPVAPTGIDYLGLIQKRRERELQQRIDYRNLPTTGDENNDDGKEMTA
jgi:putative transposase